jgi:hypothetical protein
MPLSPEDERSLLLNEAAVSAAARDWPRAQARIRKKLAELRARDAASPALIRDYEALLDQGFESFKSELLAPTERAQALRSLHPLAGLINPKQRFAILRETKRR